MVTSERLRIAADRAEWRDASGRVVIVDRQNGHMFQVTGSGASIWRLLVHGATVEQIVSSLVEEFDVDADTAAADTVCFVAALDAQGLLDTSARHTD